MGTYVHIYSLEINALWGDAETKCRYEPIYVNSTIGYVYIIYRNGDESVFNVYWGFVDGSSMGVEGETQASFLIMIMHKIYKNVIFTFCLPIYLCLRSLTEVTNEYYK